MTKERFAAFLRPYIKSGSAFKAYWHPYGFGMLFTEPMQLKVYRYTLHVPGKPDKIYKDRAKCEIAVKRHKGAWMETILETSRPREISKVALRCWTRERNYLKLYSPQPVITVDFDGLRINVEGGELEL